MYFQLWKYKFHFCFGFWEDPKLMDTKTDDWHEIIFIFMRKQYEVSVGFPNQTRAQKVSRFRGSFTSASWGTTPISSDPEEGSWAGSGKQQMTQKSCHCNTNSTALHQQDFSMLEWEQPHSFHAGSSQSQRLLCSAVRLSRCYAVFTRLMCVHHLLGCAWNSLLDACPKMCSETS